jgi:hypothetical protein
MHVCAFILIFTHTHTHAHTHVATYFTSASFDSFCFTSNFCFFCSSSALDACSSFCNSSSTLFLRSSRSLSRLASLRCSRLTGECTHTHACTCRTTHTYTYVHTHTHTYPLSVWPHGARQCEGPSYPSRTRTTRASSSPRPHWASRALSRWAVWLCGVRMRHGMEKKEGWSGSRWVW